MKCTRVSLPGGGHAIVCGSRPVPKVCVGCGKRNATQLCDWKMPERLSGTCDQPVCPDCSHVPAPDKDLCPHHAAEWLGVVG